MGGREGTMLSATLDSMEGPPLKLKTGRGRERRHDHDEPDYGHVAVRLINAKTVYSGFIHKWRLPESLLGANVVAGASHRH